MSETEVRTRQKKHQAEIRRGSLIVRDRKLTEAELKSDTIRKRRQKHQIELRGGI